MTVGTLREVVLALIVVYLIAKGGWERPYFLTVFGVLGFVMGTIWLGALLLE